MIVSNTVVVAGVALIITLLLIVFLLNRKTKSSKRNKSSKEHKKDDGLIETIQDESDAIDVAVNGDENATDIEDATSTEPAGSGQRWTPIRQLRHVLHVENL